MQRAALGRSWPLSSPEAYVARDGACGVIRRATSPCEPQEMELVCVLPNQAVEAVGAGLRWFFNLG